MLADAVLYARCHTLKGDSERAINLFDAADTTVESLWI